ncbi:polyprenyl diphosphate synthase [Umezawaea sp. Da 62-37]|uniref:polyprenyl diphosphate synthase n=1 Tax=Umezawaea sp. Da 62-37 TaxID=3075927 RepID=UPI0028F74A64|nr:polyprenyl diphosphate synthase [Umezawaea sp. Da 62-37]WNV90556.1 polyprenyl diphosphate synthase [Umezawaea sp. Da 62-37]
MKLREALESAYLLRLRAQVAKGPLPRHVAIVMDGNRRWARGQGLADVSQGHRHGAEHIEDVLRWCVDTGIRYATVFVASVDNLNKRDSTEARRLMDIVEHVVVGQVLRNSPRWRLHLSGDLDLLPDSTAHALKTARDTTLGRDFHLTLAIGYDGRQEIVEAVRTLLDTHSSAGTTPADLARTLTPADIAAHLGVAGVPDPELVIRTSGEQRMSGFLLWRAAHSELHFCDVHWPGFRHIDFLRALRAFASRRG